MELVRFAERRNPVSARVPLHFKRSLLQFNASLDFCIQKHVCLLICEVDRTGRRKRLGREEWRGEERRGENHVECLQDLMLCSSVNGYPPSVPHITVRLEFPWKSYSLFSYSFVAKLLWFENFPLWEVTSLFTDKYCMVATFLHPNRLVILGHFPPE